MRQFYHLTKTGFNSNSLSVPDKSRAFKSIQTLFVTVMLSVLMSTTALAQLGVYDFTGAGTCPNQNPAVITQPANATFSNFSNATMTCNATTDQFVYSGWNTSNTINLNEYSEFTVTPDPNYVLNLTSLSFTHSVDENGSGGGTGNTAWILRSSVDNYSTNITTGSANDNSQSPTVTLPSGSFMNVGAVTFRLYLIKARKTSTLWSIDDVTLNGSVVLLPADPGNPTSDSPQCANPGVTLTSNGTPPAGETWYWQTSATGTSTANAGSTYTVTTSGTYYIRSQDNTTLSWSNGAGSITVTVTPDVSTPVFSLGVNSTRCQGAGIITYTATAPNTSGITYSLDAASITGGNTINSSTGDVTYVAGWAGTTTITASAAGCGGPLTSIHTVTITSTVDIPTFILGATSTRCQGAGTISYTASAANATGITYSLDAASITGGNTINASTGAVTYAAGWSGTSIITATAAGCNGPTTSTHTVTITPIVGTPVFTAGATSTRCQGAVTVTYTATAINNTGITYSLDAASITGGNTINSSTGDVTYVAGWSGTSTITVSATGCSGPKTSNHTVTVTPTVGTPVFTAGATSTRCQGTGTITYAATASNNTGITYSLDAASIAGSNTINSSTGAVTYAAGWSGATIITASASGCNGPVTSTHTVTINGTVVAPVFSLGASSIRCIGAATVNYAATATNATGITYSLDGASLFGGNTINSSTGNVTFSGFWFGNSTITATAAGCGGPKTSTHTVTVNAAVATPSFTSGATSSRCQGAGTVTYTANASNTSGITYSLDAASITGGNTINSSTGAVTYTAGWSGTSIITASAAGCNGPKTATHTVTINQTVTTPTFALGATSTRCQGAATVSYTASATNATGISYSLNAASITGGNSINAFTGAVTYAAGWSGTSIITVTATGCSGPTTATHTVTITPTVGTPSFTGGATSTRCQGAGTVTYTATAINNTGITYSLDAGSITGGNTINSSTGDVTYVAGWSGVSTITASATGCSGPKTSTHTVTITPTVGTPVFALGATSTRCQGTGTVTYTATATNNTGITYSLDAASIAGSNTINSFTGAVTYAAAWTGTTTITVSAAGCNGPVTSIHTVTITPTVSTPVFALGATSTRCQGSGTLNYTATATNTTGITYSLNAASITGGNSINSSTGDVTYAASWSGTSTITASAAGCSGPKTSTHTVTITPTVGTPVFTGGATSTRCQGATTVTYAATATNNTGITYSLDAASITGGNTINSSTGAVTYLAGWTGASIITATATGCNGPSIATHTVTTTLTVGATVFAAGATSTRCQGAGMISYTASAANATGITYSLDAASITGGNTINASTGAVTYAAGWSGTSIITATAAGCNGPTTATHTVTITPTVGTPIFTAGATSTRCQGAGTVTYTATATNNTGITYSLDAASITGGNTINSSTGDVTYVAGWSGTSTITVSATGCSGPKTSNHTVTITPTVGTPSFTLGATSTRCQGAVTVTYTATATNNTGITYSLDAASITGSNTINSSTGAVTYAAGWVGTTTITASAAGCNGPAISTHTVTITPTVGVPVFTLGATSTRCQGTGTINYGATATNNTGITYSLNAASITGGNTINSSTGNVTYAAGWSGTSTITASATGCSGPKTSTHTVTITPTVGVPVFAAGAASTRCQGAGTVTYTATATNNTGITYSLDAASITGGNTINAATGAVTYLAGWSGTSVITATATGCNGPSTSTHTVTVTPTVGTPVFTLGAASTRCQGAGSVTYTATATNNTGITYSLDAPSITGSNTINAATGAVTYAAGWSGISTITASATGCNGPKTSTHTVTITPTVGTPVFIGGATSTRCQGAGTVTYTATSTNNTGITYSLDAASITGGNTINTSTGVVTYTAGWISTSTITASATGCNGPKTSTHTVTNTPTVGTPIFSLGSVSMRLQGAGTVTYTAAASNTTGITYSLDAASIAGGNTINAATGAVTYTAGWSGTTTITASAAGCNGPKTSTHTVTVNSTSVIKQLYLSDPSQSLDRVDPVNTADATTTSAGTFSSIGTTSTTFTMTSGLCSDLMIKAGTISVKNYITIVSGTMPVNPNISAVLSYGATTIITLINPTYNSATSLLTWTAILGANVTVPAGQSISLKIITAQAGVTFNIDFDSQTKPSRIDLPVSTFVNISTLDVYSAAYPGGSPVISGVGSTTKYIRATVTDPFGSSDITAMNIMITPTGSTVAATSVATTGCTRTYEYVWNTPAAGGTYVISATAKEGFENTVTNTKNINYDICSTCAPVAVADSVTGAGGSPIVVNVLANDYDPNNNINNASLAIVTQPKNGSAYISNNMIIYLPNGVYSGKDTITYKVCDLTAPTPLCATAQVYFTIDPLIIDICADAAKTHTYYIPYPEDQSYTALLASSNTSMPSNTIRTVISIKIPYPGITVVWDEWEDGYEANALNPTQATTKVWGDGNPYNGIAPGYPSDIIPAGGSIVLDNTMVANPRNPAQFYYDGKDKIVSSGQIALTQVSGEPTRMPVQSIKTNVTSTGDYGQSFTIPLGQDFNSQDFDYTALFIRAMENNTTVSVDKDNNGTLETTFTLNEGQSYLINGGVLTGATVTSDKPVGVELNAGGIDQFSIRNAPIFPATWYSNIYYTPVPTSDNAGDNPKDTSAVMFYNSLTRAININWYSGVPSSGVINVPAKSAVRFPLAYSTTAAYKFVNLTGESFTAIEIVDSYTPVTGANDGSTYDWSFNLISDSRLTDYTTVAWAPGGLDLVAPPGPDVNGNPIWVTPTANTTIYVKYDGNISGSAGSVSPCGLKYDVSYSLNALNYMKIKDPSDNDQSGIAIYTCDGTKIASVYGEDPKGSTTGIGIAYWDVGSTIQPFCKQKLVIAEDDYATTLVSQPVTITVLDNDFGFLASIDPGTVSTVGLQQPAHGTVSVNANGTILYIPNAGYAGMDTFEYNVCSTPAPIICDLATVIVKISTCPSNGNQNIISGQVFIDKNKDASNNDGGTGFFGGTVYLYTDGNCNGTATANELIDSVTVDSSGFYQFTRYPEKTLRDDFDGTAGASSCASGTDGDTPWTTLWSDAGDGSAGFCQAAANPDAEIVKDGTFGYGLRLKDKNVSATRSANLSGATKAFLTFSYRRKSATLTTGRNIFVQASLNGSAFTTIYTIAGDGTTDAGYVTVYNQDITSYASANSAIRFLTNGSLGDADSVYIGDVTIKYLKYPQCYLTLLSAASVPATYYATTAVQKAASINSGGSCTSQFDFGLAKTSITVSGTLFNDGNGLTDNLVNGSAIGSPGGAVVYAYLADTLGKVAFKTSVNSATGAYSFSTVDVNANYTLILSTTNVAISATAPASAGFSSTWVSVGDAYGTNNAAGTGNKTGTPQARITVKTSMSNVTNVNFGIQRLPNSDNYTTSINQPSLNQFITLNGGMNPPILSGSDPEDCTSGCALTARSVLIDTVPANAALYYNNVLVTNGQTITNFNPALFKVKITNATWGTTSLSFRYSFVDAAVMKDPTPATYKLLWLIALPADGLTAVATLSGSMATVKWTTLSEQNTSYYVVERSPDGSNFTATGNKIPAAGNSADKREYEMPDNISSLRQNNVIYYRVKLMDIDGKARYSNVVALRLSQKAGVTIWPNPFHSSITISITTEKETIIEINMIDVNGRTIRNINQPAAKGISQIPIRNLEQLPAGVYLVEITDKIAGTTYQVLLTNN